MSDIAMDDKLAVVRQAIEGSEAAIREEQAAIAALRIQQVRQREESLAWFEGLSDSERSALFRSSPEAYRLGMAAIERRNERRLMGR